MLTFAFLAACGTPETAAPTPSAPVEIAPTPPAPPPAPVPGPSTARASAGRLVAVGDLHSDSIAAVKVLEMAKLVDAEGRWVGGTATLVQTGDQLDRGPDSAGVIALLRRLQGEAAAAGGAVVPLLGNHEVMNVQGDWRYVSAEDNAGYGGVEARMKAFSRAGEDGAWLGGLDAVALIDGTVFCHGGVRASFATRGTDALSQGVRDAMFVPKSKADVIGPDGPLWWRGYAQDPEATACPELDLALAALSATRMVIGHTVQDGGKITTRCGGKLIAIDTGISAHYGTHLSAYEQVGGDARAIYPTGTEDLVDP